MMIVPILGSLRVWVGAAVAVAWLAGLAPAPAWADGQDAPTVPTIDFDRDIRPILSNTCYHCHGPDPTTRKAGLRLDSKPDAFATLRSGSRAIVPGNPDESELLLRITAEPDDPGKMPPPEAPNQLTPDQIQILTAWIQQGAPWTEHWAFLPPQRPTPPSIKPIPGDHAEPIRNPIDAFIRDRLQREGLVPNPVADPVTLIRRVTLDLTGLPPTPDEIDAFVAETARDPAAYDKLVDRLLESPRHAEHQARLWLDAARYGDTHGLHLDNERSIWPYRDWVIEAYRKNLPFNQFVIEQLAGDLLPNATVSQNVASGFNRCNVTTSEGGAIDAEFDFRYAVDRAETVGTVFLGLTAGCAVCHDHKYDPLTQKEFYQLYAFFYNMADAAMDGNALLPPPSIKVPTPEQERALAEARDRWEKAEAAFNQALATLPYRDPVGPTQLAELTNGLPRYQVWIDDDLPDGAKPTANGTQPWTFITKDQGPVFLGQRAHTRTAQGLDQHYFTDAAFGLTIDEGDRLFAYVWIDPQNPPKAIMLQFHAQGNWNHRVHWGENLIPFGEINTPANRPMGPLPPPGKWVRLEVDAAQVGLTPGMVVDGWAFTQHDGTVYWDAAGIVSGLPQGPQVRESLALWSERERRRPSADLPNPVKQALAVEPEKRDDSQRATIRMHFLAKVHPLTQAALAAVQSERDQARSAFEAADAAIPATLISQERAERRQAYVMERGQYDRPTEPVQPGVPSWLPPLPPDAPPNRLGLALWLTRPDHPLTSRVTVNRFWQQCFGVGLVKTTEDFGVQGDRPSHPDLLDWLAVEFVESGWNVRHLLKLIVSSATYRQSSAIDPSRLELDPSNRWLSRAPRFRLDGEVIRDQALLVSGLLVERIGGKSVKPYQPSGLWEAVGFTSSNTAKFVQDHGEALYRRSLYTFWKRTSPPPMLQLFDAPTRESCVVRRPRTNTPLQALALMNDIQFVEAARVMAARLLNPAAAYSPTALSPASADESRLVWGFRLVVGREPTTNELAILQTQLSTHRHHYAAHVEQARRLVKIGEAPAAEHLDPVEHAAWTIICNLLLNLDEALTRP